MESTPRGSRSEQVDAWVAAARNGDELATDELCRFLSPRLAAWLAGRMGRGLRRWTSPADIAQAVLTEAIGGLGELPLDVGATEFEQRLRQRANWRLIDAARRFGRDAGESRIPDHEYLPTELVSEGTVTCADDRRWLRELVARLPEKYREVVGLCALEGLTYAEAGAQIGLHAETVRKRYERAREALSLRLSERRK